MTVLDHPLMARVYVLGCLDRRVTVCSQQIRAANLVFAMFEERVVASGSSVVVVGGGAAGVTAAAAAASKGAQVVLLERETQLVHMQHGSTNRWIHPFLYDWPDKKYLQTTEGIDAPLLGWQASPAGMVADWLRTEFQAYASRFGIKLHMGVKDVLVPPATGGQPRVVTWGEGRAHADAVILAVGFGEERQFPPLDLRSYWHDDRLHQYFRKGPKHLLISGVGDGGLMDVLRARILDFRPNEAVSGPLADLFACKEMEGVAERLLDIEQESSRVRLVGGNPDAFISKKYAEMELPESFDRALSERLRKDTQATLNGPGQYPLGRGASILNRFLVSRLVYGLKDVQYWHGVIPEKGIKKEGEKFLVDLGSGDARWFNDVVIRHGAVSALNESFPEISAACAASLRRSADFDQTRTPLWPAGWFGGTTPVEERPLPSLHMGSATFPINENSNPRHLKDIEVLLAYSQDERARLSKHKALPVDGGILLSRDCLAPLRAAAESGSLLVTGEPGAGKTGVLLLLADQMDELPRPTILLSVDRFSGCHTRIDFRNELGLDNDLVKVLDAWPGTERGLLIFDALDASRGGPSEAVIASFIEEAVRKLGSRWSIIASIRSSDLRNGRRFSELMLGTPPNSDFVERGLKNVRHFHVPQLSNSEVAAVSAMSPKLRELEESAPGKLRKLLRNIFNLSLAADLLRAGEDPQSIRAVSTQSGLIRRYEDIRLPTQPLRRAVKAAVSVMVQRQQLAVRATDIDNDAVDNVREAGVLISAGDNVSFAHHVLFDHMASRFYLSSDNPGVLHAQITQGPMIGLMLGPALRFTLDEIWETDRDGRPKTWQFLVDLAAAADADPVVQSVAVRTAAERVAAPSDVDALCVRIESEQGIEVVGRLVGQLSRFVGIAAAEYGVLLPSAAEAWGRVARVAAATKVGRLVDAARTLLMTLVEQSDLSVPRVLNTFGDAARTLLNAAWALSPGAQPLAIAGIRFVARSYGTDPEAARALLARILDDRFEEHASQEAPWLAEGVTSIIPHDPDFVVRVFATLFGREVKDETKTWLGGTPSRIMPMSSTPRQDYLHARWHLNEALKSFLDVNPRAATAAVIVSTQALDAARRATGSSPQMITRLRIGEKEVKIFDDLLSLLDWRESPIEGLAPLDTFVDFLRDCPREAFREAVMVAQELPTNAAVWARLLGIAAVRPEVADDILWPIAAAPCFAVLRGLYRDAVFFLASAYPRQPTNERLSFESVAVAQDLFLGTREAAWWSTVLKQFLSLVPEDLLVTPEMRTLRSSLEESNELSGNPPLVRMDVGWVSSDGLVEAQLRGQGVDLERSPDREIRAASHQLEERLKQNEDAADATFLAYLWADILGVVQLLDSGTAQAPHPELVHSSWGAVSNGVQRLAKSVAYSPGANGLPDLDPLINLIERLSTSPYPRNDPSPSNQMSWGNWDVRVYGASSLVALAPRFAIHRPDILDRMAVCLHDPCPTVRHQISASLCVLREVAADRMWKLLADVAEHETHPGVLQFFVAGMSSLSHDEPERCAVLLNQVLQRGWAWFGDAEAANHQACHASFAHQVALLYVAHGQVLAWKWIELWASDLRRGADYIAAMLHNLRQVFFLPYLDDLTTNQLEIAWRSRKLLDLVVGSAVGALEEAGPHLIGTPSREAIEIWRPLYVAGDSVLDQVCDQFYFGSGAFRSSEDSEPRPGLQDAVSKKRFLVDNSAVLDVLAEHAQSHTIHKLVALLAYLVGGDPSGVFDRIARTLLGPAAADGYHFEPLALNRLVRLIRLYLADHREIFEEAARRQSLVAVLELFSSAGWPEAMKVLFELPDLLR